MNTRAIAWATIARVATAVAALTALALAFLGPGRSPAWREAHAAQAVPPVQDVPLTQPPRTITVGGEASVRVVPDEVVFTLGIETWDQDLDVAKRLNDDRVSRVLAVAKELGVADRYVQTEHMSIEPRYRDGYEKRDFVGYFVRKTVVITLKDLDAFEDLLSGVLEAGANYVHGIQFRTTELRAHRDKARSLAIRAAQEKAVAMAGELGQKVGDPLSIHEEASGWRSWYGAWWGPWSSSWGPGMAQNVIQELGDSAVAADGTVAPGQISIDARVTVAFELE